MDLSANEDTPEGLGASWASMDVQGICLGVFRPFSERPGALPDVLGGQPGSKPANELANQHASAPATQPVSQPASQSAPS